MRKHFLILMLMALLPLAGWAASATNLPGDLAVTFAVKDGGTEVTKYTGNDLTVAIKTAKATVGSTANTDVSEKIELDGTYSDQACSNAITVKNAGLYYVRVKGKGTDYLATSTKVFELTVAKFGDIHVAAKPLAKTYGQDNPTTGYYTVTLPTGFPDGSTLSTDIEKAAAAGLVITPSFKDWEKNKAADTYQFEISNNTVTNYNVVVDNKYANLTINKANLIVQAETKSVEYGTAPVYSVTYGPALYPGDDVKVGVLAYDVKSTADPTKTYDDLKGAAGTYTITPKGLTSDNYNFDYQNGTLTVNPRNISHVTFVMAGTTYNSSDKLADLKKFKTLTDDGTLATAADFEVSIFEDETGGDALATATQAKKYWAEIKAATSGSNYTGTVDARVPVVLAQKQLNIITQNKEIDYNNATYTPTIADVVFNGLETADATTGADDQTVPASGAYATGKSATDFKYSLSTPGVKKAGVYTINVSSETAADKLFKNYKVNFVNVGELTINKVQVTLKPADKDILYGDVEPDWANATEDMFEIKFYNKKTNTEIADIAATLGDDLEEDVFVAMPTIERVIPAGKTAGEVGEYVLNAVGYELVANGNYEYKAGEPKTGKLTISAATSITVVVDDVNAVYGEYKSQADLETAKKLGYRLSGVKNTDKDKVTVTFNVVSQEATPKPFAGKRGTYDIKATATLDESIAANYEGVSITYLDGKLTVGKAPLKVKVLDQSLIGDDTDGEKFEAASASTVEILTEGLAEADKAALFDDEHGIQLKWGNALESGTHYDATTKKLKAAAAAAGYSGTTEPATPGVWVKGITIDAVTYNNNVNANYTLASTVEGVEITDGTLYVVAAGAELNMDASKTDDDVVTKIAAVNNKKVTAKITKRAIPANTWAVMVLPFETTVREVSKALGYAVVDVLDTNKGDGNYIYFKLHVGKIAANQPFMVKLDEAIANTANILFEKKVVVKAAGDVTTPVEGRDIDAGGTEFIGVYKQQELQGAKQLWLSGDGVWGYNKNNKKVPVGATRAYLQLPESSTGNAHIFVEEADGSTTAITAIAADGTAIEATGWYTLNGIRLEGAPTQKGIYINNGKKIVIK